MVCARVKFAVRRNAIVTLREILREFETLDKRSYVNPGPKYMSGSTNVGQNVEYGIKGDHTDSAGAKRTD